MKKAISRTSLLISGILFAGSGYANTTGYKLTLLDTQSGWNSTATGINDIGQVVGVSRNLTNGMAAATLWNGAARTYLYTENGWDSNATDINNAGQIVGYSNGHNGAGAVATMWGVNSAANSLAYIGEGYAMGINNSGQVAGLSTGGATIWNGTVPTYVDANLNGTMSAAFGINDAGQTAGYSGFDYHFDSGRVATSWGNGTTTSLESHGESAGFGINSSGIVAGYTGGNNNNVATIWNGTTATYLDSQYSIAYSINDLGQVVGGGALGATLWIGTTATNLNSFLTDGERSEWILASATAINENGVIAGDAINRKTRLSMGFVLSPVPEPETYAMMLCGLGIVGSFAKRKEVFAKNVA